MAGRRLLDGVLYLPIIIPDVTMAVMLLVFFSEAADIIDRLPFIDLSSGLETLVISHVAFNISFVSVVVRARLANLDPSAEGCRRPVRQPLADVPARHPPADHAGVIGGALLAITLSLDDVVVSSFVQAIGSTPLPVFVFGLVRRGQPAHQRRLGVHAGGLDRPRSRLPLVQRIRSSPGEPKELIP